MKRLLCVLLMVVFTTSCASVFKGTTQTVTFNSNPDEAEVILDGKPVGVTPLSISLKKNAIDAVLIKKDGYKSQSFALDKKYDGITLLSIFWDLSTTDLITGAAYEYHPDQFHVELKKRDMEEQQEEQMEPQEQQEEQMEPQEQQEEEMEPQEQHEEEMEPQEQHEAG